MSQYDKFYCKEGCPHVTSFTFDVLLQKGNGPKAVNGTLQISRFLVLMETNRVFHSFVKVSHCAGIILALMGRRKNVCFYYE